MLNSFNFVYWLLLRGRERKRERENLLDSEAFQDKGQLVNGHSMSTFNLILPLGR